MAQLPRGTLTAGVSFLKRFLPVLPALLLICCKTVPDRETAIGEAFAGPASLTLHKDIDVKSAASAVAHHGDRLEIIGRRRRWYRVRTAKGAEGWTDDRALMDTGQMQRLLALAKNASQLPSQGAASSFGVLNVHTEPNRLSASFVQVKEGERFDVIAHRVVARAPLPRRQLVVPKPKAEKKAKSKQKASGPPPPPPPVPPGPPPDWVALSKERAQVSEENLPPAARDDWTLIRTKGGQTGWVLTGRVYMAIPDEVAQYAEGHRITAYFQVGSVMDEGEQKPFWLWTTAVGLGEDHDFDGYRVFTWNARRHRYETAYIQRRERGFFPVLAKAGQFSVCLEREDGTRVRKQYSLVGNLVRGAGEKVCEVASADDESSDGLPQLHVPETPVRNGGFWEGVKSGWKRLRGKP